MREEKWSHNFHFWQLFFESIQLSLNPWLWFLFLKLCLADLLGETLSFPGSSLSGRVRVTECNPLGHSLCGLILPPHAQEASQTCVSPSPSGHTLPPSVLALKLDRTVLCGICLQSESPLLMHALCSHAITCSEARPTSTHSVPGTQTTRKSQNLHVCIHGYCRVFGFVANF